MSTLDSVFGQVAQTGGAEPATLALIALFSSPIAFKADEFRARLREYDRETSTAEVEALDGPSPAGTFAGRVKWGSHVADMVGFDAPAPKTILDLCIPPAHYGDPLKQLAYEHRAHMLLYHRGPEQSALERYVALAAVAGVLELMGAVAVLNEPGYTSLPAGVFSPSSASSDRMEHLRNLPIALFYIGFVKYNLPTTASVWMRTHGADVFGVPDLAMLTPGHESGQQTMDRFDLILGYMIGKQAVVRAGHTMQIADEHLGFRKPTPADPEDGGHGQLLVVEKIKATEINQPGTNLEARDLTLKEMNDLRTVAQKAILAFSDITLGSPAESIVRAIDQEIRRRKKQSSGILNKLLHRAPQQDVSPLAIGLGALWGNQIVSRYGWQWVCLMRMGKREFVVAPQDRSFAIFPADHIRKCLTIPQVECAVKSSFENIAASRLPRLSEGGYRDILL